MAKESPLSNTEEKLTFAKEYRKETRENLSDVVINEFHEKGMDPREGFSELQDLKE